MGFAGFVTSGLVPAVGGALRGRNAASQRAEEQRRYDTEQMQQASEVKWRQQQALEAAQRQAMMDALAQQAQMAAQKGGAESRAIQMAALNKPPTPQEAYETFEGPQGLGVYGVTEGQEPRFLGKPAPSSGGLGNRPIVERDPVSGKITYRNPQTGQPMFTGQVSPKPTTQDERTAAGQAARLQMANEQMARFKPPAGFAERWEQIRLQQGDNTNIEKVLPFLSDQERAFMAAAINFAGTVGYLESGKALTVAEVKRLFNIIELDNDGPETRSFKKQLRDVYVQSANAQAGRAAGSVVVPSAEPPDENAVIDAVMDEHPEWDDAQVMSEVQRRMTGGQ